MNLVLGISLMAIGALGLIAIISYNALDKSLNTISDAPPENILGIPGSYTSDIICLLYTSPSPRDQRGSRMPSSA